ncbi:hypothetical protein OH76DRAFT_767394 [Lentinus brumalis]|uniref:4Fe-4S ferredoxin-type domain-containing protein n=1 Tax=Lentinus brumalis TaxID=2498619 RepID=A0A371D4L9_9APHY|nr:hypothetical protein OH76DRAFT_767394 [Polyporus brumalis]
MHPIWLWQVAYLLVLLPHVSNPQKPPSAYTFKVPHGDQARIELCPAPPSQLAMISQHRISRSMRIRLYRSACMCIYSPPTRAQGTSTQLVPYHAARRHLARVRAASMPPSFARLPDDPPSTRKSHPPPSASADRANRIGSCPHRSTQPPRAWLSFRGAGTDGGWVWYTRGAKRSRFIGRAVQMGRSSPSGRSEWSLAGCFCYSKTARRGHGDWHVCPASGLWTLPAAEMLRCACPRAGHAIPPSMRSSVSQFLFDERRCSLCTERCPLVTLTDGHKYPRTQCARPETNGSGPASETACNVTSAARETKALDR